VQHADILPPQLTTLGLYPVANELLLISHFHHEAVNHFHCCVVHADDVHYFTLSFMYLYSIFMHLYCLFSVFMCAVLMFLHILARS